jgi:ABC-2 type transport system ATP-binding protein
MAAEAMIAARALTKRYGDKTVVDRLDLDVAPGEVFGLLGPNGAGKTTTILMLLGLSEPSAGTVRVAGFDPARHPLDVKSVVGYLPDDVGFYGNLSGRQNLVYTAQLNRLPASTTPARVSQTLDEVGLTEAADKPAGTYSRGMRQRLGIADALIKDPQVLILDEPTIGIDPEGVTEMLALVGRLTRERGVTVLLSSHLLHQVQEICDRVGIFFEGRMVAVGRPGELAAGLGSSGAVLEVVVDGDADAVRAVLGGVPGVTAVDENPRALSAWTVTAVRDVTGEVAAAVVGAGMRLRLLRRLDDDLDRVYHRYFEEHR